MIFIDVTYAVEALVEKANFTTDANDALKFSQAACNVANARVTMMQSLYNEQDNTG